MGNSQAATTVEEALAEYSALEGDCKVWTHTLNHNGYGQFLNHRYGTLLVHKIVWEQANGPVPESLFIDHRCTNRRCHNLGHLRLATKKQNAENMADLRMDNYSGYRGVSMTANGKWRAMATHHGKQISAGTHECRHAAGEAARLLRLKLFTHNDSDCWKADGTPKK